LLYQVLFSRFEYLNGDNNICFTGVIVGTAGPIVPTVAVANIVTIPATSCLFFFRLSAIYVHNKIVVMFFGIVTSRAYQ
jgi:hypothetical protein